MTRKALRPLMMAGVLALVALAPTRAQAQASDVVYVASDLTSLPRMASIDRASRTIQASYPEHLRRNGVGGTVQLQLIIGPDGKVEPNSIQVVSSTVPELGEAATKAAEKLEFVPGKVKDSPVRSKVILPITYRAS